MSRAFYLFRKYRLGNSDLGDATYVPVRQKYVQGYWIHSPTRGEIHDVVVYYVPGGGFQRASPYFYMEYWLTFLVSLQLQGFRNPAIFALEYTHVPDASASQQLNEVANGWDYLTSELGLETVVAMGDSNGGALVLSLLLHIVNPYEAAHVVSTKLPAAAVVISPFTKLRGPWVISGNDYITESVLTRYMDGYSGGDETSYTDPHLNPGLCKSHYWWSRAIPKPGGIYFMYGENETLASEIEQTYQNIKDLGRVARDSEPNHIHSWPLVSMYIGRTKADRTRGIDKIANNIARMILWTTSTEPDEATTQEVNKERAAIQRYLETHRVGGNRVASVEF